VFAGAARGAVFSNPEVVRRVNADFVPVALKAFQVNSRPPGEEGRLYQEIGRSKPAPQGICVANSAGKVLAWALMFDDDASVVGFLDYALKRFATHPKTAVATERFMKYPSQKMSAVEDDGQAGGVPESHAKGERCLGDAGFPEGTLLGRAYGRAFKDGKPVGDATQQEHYVEDRFEVSVEAQEALAKASGGDGRFALPEGLTRALVATAHLGMLDVNPLGAPGGKNDRRKWEFWGRKDGARLRFEGTSDVAGGSGESRGGQNSDGRYWTHEVTLTWKGALEMKGNRIERLRAVAEGREKLTWGNDRMSRPGQSEVAQLPAGRPMQLDCDVRYGFEGRPAAGHEIGAGPDPTPQDAPGDLPAKVQKFHAAVQRAQKEGRDLSAVGKIMEGFEGLLKEGKHKEAGDRIDQALKALGDDAAPAPQGTPDSLHAKMQKLQEALQARQEKQKAIETELQKLPPLVQQEDFAAAEKQIDKILELLKKP